MWEGGKGIRLLSIDVGGKIFREFVLREKGVRPRKFRRGRNVRKKRSLKRWTFPLDLSGKVGKLGEGKGEVLL